MNLYRVVFKSTDYMFVIAGDPTSGFNKADMALEAKGYMLSSRTLKFVELIASKDCKDTNVELCL